MINYYMVGGYVRDSLMGIKSKDIDFAIEVDSYEDMREDLLKRGVIFFQERPEYFSIRGKHPTYGPADFTVCRKDGFYSDTRHPDIVHIGTIYDDLARRDFTVNAIAFTEKDGIGIPSLGGYKFIDPHKGITDINDKLLRCVGDPVERFAEDSLRILRAVRFHIVRDFWLDSSIEDSLNDYSIVSGLESTSKERVYEELKKCYEYNSWATHTFFRQHKLLENMIFDGLGLQLTVRI